MRAGPQPRLEDLPEGAAKRTNEQNKCVYAELTWLVISCNSTPWQCGQVYIYHKKKDFELCVNEFNFTGLNFKFLFTIPMFHISWYTQTHVHVHDVLLKFQY